MSLSAINIEEKKTKWSFTFVFIINIIKWLIIASQIAQLLIVLFFFLFIDLIWLKMNFTHSWFDSFKSFIFLLLLFVFQFVFKLIHMVSGLNWLFVFCVCVCVCLLYSIHIYYTLTSTCCCFGLYHLFIQFFDYVYIFLLYL